MRGLPFALALVVGLAPQALADPVEILSVRVVPAGQGTWRFDVEVRHPDEGWDHYADAWEVLAPDGRVLGTRVLLHPHVEEQPFTRGLSGVMIGPEVAAVTLRARCSVDGFAGAQTVTVPLER